MHVRRSRTSSCIYLGLMGRALGEAGGPEKVLTEPPHVCLPVPTQRSHYPVPSKPLLRYCASLHQPGEGEQQEWDVLLEKQGGVEEGMGGSRERWGGVTLPTLPYDSDPL